MNENYQNIILALPIEEGYLLIRFFEILHCEAQGNYSKFHLEGNRTITISKKLKEVEAILPKNLFLRVHHSHLVNLQHAKFWIKGENQMIRLSNGDLIKIARSKSKDLKNKVLMI